MKAIEIWIPIKGYEGIYEISNKSRVKALQKIVVGGRYNCPRLFKEKILKDSNGDVSLCKNKVKKTYDVYTLKQVHFNNFKPTGERKELVKNDGIITRRKFVQDINRQFKNKSSKYVGISWHKGNQKWRALIVINKKYVHLGVFENELDAVFMYEKAVRNTHLYKGISNYFRSMLNEVFLSEEEKTSIIDKAKYYNNKINIAVNFHLNNKYPGKINNISFDGINGSLNKALKKDLGFTLSERELKEVHTEVKEKTKKKGLKV